MIQLHRFSDASQLAYAACVYARVESDDGSVVVTLLTAKSKMAPIKHQSIPRLELNGAVLLTRLLEYSQPTSTQRQVSGNLRLDILDGGVGLATTTRTRLPNICRESCWRDPGEVRS